MISADWTEGYRADIDYTYGYYGELNPLRAQLPLLAHGIAPSEPLVACELGFGQGLSVNMHAAAQCATWYGTDFNPSQAAGAQHLARLSGADARLFDEAFEQFCQRPDLPEFDFIGVHGIWSWISDHNRKIMVDFFRRKLKVGGLVYISYNTYPGWAAMVPLRQLLTEHAEVMGASGRGIASRIDAAIEFVEKLIALNPLFARANPQLSDRLKKIKSQSRNYLAHEYFNRDWQPMSFAEMGHWLAPAKLGYACSAHYLDSVDALNLTRESVAFLKEIPDAMFRETVRDYFVNQQFRRDYWIRGPRRLTALEQIESLRQLRVVLVTAHADLQFKASGSLGEAAMQEQVYKPLADLLADHKVRTLEEIEKELKAKSIALAQCIEAIVVLAGKGDVVLAQDEKKAGAAKARADSLNHHLMLKARGSNRIQYLASPVTGGGVPVDRFLQLFLLARRQGARTPEDWARAAWTDLERQGQRIIKDGKAIESSDDNLAELTRQAREFAEKKLPSLQVLRIA